MKKLLSLFIVLAFTCLSINAQTWPPEGMQGAGAENDPWQIATPAQLEALALYVNAGNGSETKGKYYKLMNHINLIDYAQGEGWMPIGRSVSGSNFSKAFQGKFNGNGNVILNLTINRPTEEHIGLFGLIYHAVIRNLGIDNCNIVALYLAGGLAGSNMYSEINNCFVTGNVNGNYCTGGLVGRQVGGIIKNCYASVKVEGGEYEDAGGLLGSDANNPLISHCYTRGSVKGNDIIGGLVGGYGKISNCVAANDSIIAYSSSTDIKRIATGGTLSNNYALNSMVVKNIDGDISITDGLNTKDGKGVAVELLQSVDFYATLSNWFIEAWDINSDTSAWRICDGENFPFLRWQRTGCEIFTITATAGENGIIHPAGDISVIEFDSQTFTFSANAGYKIDSLFIDGEPKPEYIAAGSYTFEDVVANHTIYVTFVKGNGVASPALSDLQVYPNPTTGELRIENEELRITNVEIYDVYGRKLTTYDLRLTTKIDISHFPAGIYFLHVNEKNIKITKL